MRNYISLKRFYFNHKGKRYEVIAASLYYALLAIEKRFNVTRRTLKHDPFYSAGGFTSYDYNEIKEVKA